MRRKAALFAALAVPCSWIRVLPRLRTSPGLEYEALAVQETGADFGVFALFGMDMESPRPAPAEDDAKDRYEE